VSTVARGTKQIEKVKLNCTSCGNEKNPTEFYTSNSPFHKHTGKLHLCKDCFWEFVGEDVNKLKVALRMVDKPFMMSLFISSQEEAEKSEKNTSSVKNYIKNVSMPQYKYYSWDDSDFEGHKVSKQIDTGISSQNIGEVDENISKEDLKELTNFFGRGFKTEDYIWLQSEYIDFLNRYECDSKGMELLIKEICLQQLDIQNRRANGEKVDTQLKTLQDLLGSSNLKPVQETGANAVEQESFGTLIKKFERDKPIPEPDPMWKDVDGISKYIKTFFFGHMARALGIENKFQNDYDDEILKYTVEQTNNNDGDIDG
jgi:ribosomal protein L33